MNIPLPLSTNNKKQDSQQAVKQQQVIYYVDLQQPNGTTLAPICDNQVNSAVLTFQDVPENSLNNTKEPAGNKPLGSCENPIEIIRDGERIHSTQNLSQDYLQQIAQALQIETIELDQVFDNQTIPDEPNIIYQVVHPEELNLIAPSPKTKRGRPKNPPSGRKVTLEIPKEPVAYKSVRTRSGRITRTPRYIKKDFKKIEISDLDNMETDLKTVDFEPGNENEITPPKPPINDLLKTTQPKRHIPSQLRCPKCNKAYLGNNKMLKHLEKYPDHGLLQDHFKLKCDQTLNYLISLCKKKPDGEKGAKFCKELYGFLQSLQDFAKLFFLQPSAKQSEKLYFVDDFLSQILGISSGQYHLKEDEFKNVSKFIFENNDAKVSEICENVKQLDKSDKVTNDNLFNLGNYSSSFPSEDTVTKDRSRSQENENIQELVSQEKISNTNSELELSFQQKLINSGQYHLKENEFKNVSKFVFKNNNVQVNESLENDKQLDKSDKLTNDNLFNLSNFNTAFPSKDTVIEDCTRSQENENVELVSQEKSSNTNSESGLNFQQKLSFDLNNHEFLNCTSISEKQFANSLQSDHILNNFHDDKNVAKPTGMSTDLTLSNELLTDNLLLTSLPNLRSSVDDLMLNNVDAVPNLLDNSTSSDEVMNVDQFVNERFQNLTQPDLELHNNLDLQGLDSYEFPTN